MTNSTDTTDTTKALKPKVFTVAWGFYFFGFEVEAPEWFLAAKWVAMFRGFEGEWLPWVLCGKKGCSVNLDRLDPEWITYRPLCNVYAVHQSINLYEWSGSTIK